MVAVKVEPLIVAEANGVQLGQEKENYRKEKYRECLRCYAHEGKPHERDCGYQLTHTWSTILPPCDFRSISRDADRVETRIAISLDPYDRTEYEWIVAGQGSLDRYDERTGQHTLRVYLGRGATDFEHDSAYVLQLGLYGVRFKGVSYHRTEVQAFIPPDLRLEDFRVPKAGYDPFLIDPYTCEEGHCEKEPHPIVPEGCYVPKGDREQWKLLRGRRVRIVFGPAREET